MSFFGVILDLLYPPRCAFCHRLLQHGNRDVCRACLRTLPYTGDRAEREKIPHVDRCLSPLYYEKDVRKSVHRYKFGRLTLYAGIYADYMIQCLGETARDCDCVCFVPVSRRRRRSRGFDQAELLARELSGRLGRPCVPSLRKIRHNRAQSSTASAAERRENVKGAYRCTAGERVKDKRVLLVDDVVTTGSTLSECAAVLRAAGAASVSAVTLARVRQN